MAWIDDACWVRRWNARASLSGEPRRANDAHSGDTCQQSVQHFRPTADAEDTIRVVATDDFDVKEVHVVLRRLAGELIEQGAPTGCARSGNP
jgi:hypothetical protein